MAALGAALALWIGPAPAAALEAAEGLCRRVGDLGLALAAAPDGAVAANTASAVARQLERLHGLPGLDVAAPLVQQASEGWRATQAALAANDRGAAVDALAGLRGAAVALATEIERHAAQRARQRELALAASAALAGGVVVWAGLAMRRQRRTLRQLARQVSADLGSGSWQNAVQSLRDDRLGAPSAFDALASGVEEVMGASERRWQTLADLAADWYWETDTGHRLAWMSGSGPLFALQGLGPQALLGRRHDEIEGFEPPLDGWSRWHALLDAGRAFRDLEFRIRPAGAGDEAVWVAISGRPRHDAAGRFVGYEGVGRNVTERKQAHERLRASNQRWALMAGLASDYYWETDTEHRLQPLRPEVARRFGAIAEHTEGRTYWEAFPDAMGPSQWAEHREDVAARRPFRGVELDIQLDDGRRRIIALSGEPRFDGAGRFLGYHGIGRDITLRREAERLLLRHNEALQRAVTERTQDLEQINRDLDAFSRELAHELRTPIGHVQGLAHLLVTKAGDRLSSDEMQLIGLQLQAARHMRETVDALLMLARSTIQPLEFALVDVSGLARVVAADLPPQDRAAPLQWQIEDGLYAHASAPALRIVLANLLGNAAKFTREVAAPQVRVSGGADADGRLRVRVQDNGAGFDMAQVERLFKPFGRLHNAQDYQGTGIGLTIVQRIVERHGGRVAAHGRVGQGACFEFTLTPAEAPAADART